MFILVTSATGFVGSALVDELLSHGHSVLALARSDASASSLAAKETRIEILRGTVDDLDILRQAASRVDAVVHLAFNHEDLSKMAQSGKQEADAVRVMGDALIESTKKGDKQKKSLIAVSGVLLLANGQIINEDQPLPSVAHSARWATTELASSYHNQGIIRSACFFLPPSTHGKGDRGFIPFVMSKARSLGYVPYLGDGEGMWPATHRNDVATLMRLYLEDSSSEEDVFKILPIADRGLPWTEIAGTIGQTLSLSTKSVSKEELTRDLTWMTTFVSMSAEADSTKTKKRYGWEPKEAGLLQDIYENYGEARSAW